MQYSDIVSADSYWMTDGDLELGSQGGCALLPNSTTACTNYVTSSTDCPAGTWGSDPSNWSGGSVNCGLTAAQTQLAANYSYDVTRLETLNNLNSTSKPVAVDVETGCPFNNGNCTTPAQTTAAAWQALIAGARGIIWFQHNFSGPCDDDRTFIDGSNSSSSMYNCQQTSGVTLHDVVTNVTAFDNEVNGLNSQLLSPFAQGYVTTSSDVSVMAKYDSTNNSFYIFAGSGQPANPPSTNQTATFTIAGTCPTSITVYNESRTLSGTNTTVSGNPACTFSDTFADSNAVHIYQINNTASGGGSSAPSAPTLSLLSGCSVTSNTVDLSWTASTGSPTGYYVYRNGTKVATVSSSTLNYLDSGLTPGTSYSYYVAAYNGSGSTSSNTLSQPTENKIGDLDCDDSVTGHDLSLLLAHYGANYPQGEFDGFAQVEGHDLSLLLTDYGH
jgi:hypothetical protein